MALQYDNLSSDLIWEISRKQNSFLCKRKTGGGVQFSRDPMNLANVHNRKYSGFANEKAIGVNADSINTVALTTKNPKRLNKPATQHQTTSFSSSTPNRKVYRSVVNSTARRGYRPDLRAEAVARASAVKRSQGEKKDSPAIKLRGARARKAKEAGASS